MELMLGTIRSGQGLVSSLTPCFLLDCCCSTVVDRRFSGCCSFASLRSFLPKVVLKMEVLPSELRSVIWVHLDSVSICRATSVSEKWRAALGASDQKLWEALCWTSMPLVARALKRSRKCWKGLFRALASTRQLKEDNVLGGGSSTDDQSFDSDSEEDRGESTYGSCVESPRSVCGFPEEPRRDRFLVVAIVNESHAGLVDLETGVWVASKRKREDTILSCAVTRITCGGHVDLIVPRQLSLRVLCVDTSTYRAAHVVDDLSMCRAELVENEKKFFFTKAGDLLSYGRFSENERLNFLGFVNVRAVPTRDDDKCTNLSLVAAGIEISTRGGHRLPRYLDTELEQLCNRRPKKCQRRHEKKTYGYNHQENNNAQQQTMMDTTF